ncbi:hypothetical protein CMI42_04025 [Candidatus Pacearchaeota archaeon]|nr:hypothetical protein [Candidatus Pacearchaeota archaeon]|tara:strand:- start:529 stop:936 length:408 start_codon:yes stop_codon:yes gene_type:complete
MKAETIAIGERAPLFIEEFDPGLFYIVKEIKIRRDGTFYFKYFDEYGGPLSQGLEINVDLREIPNRGIPLLVECSNEESIISAAFELMKSQAYRDNYDYFSYQPIKGDSVVGKINVFGTGSESKVIPRLFTKILG